MLIDAYLRYELKEETKTRYNLNYHSKPFYEPLNLPDKRGELFVYFSRTPEHIRKRQINIQSDYSLSVGDSFYISKLVFASHQFPGVAVGDMKNTNDCILFVKKGNVIELFICKNRKQVATLIFQHYLDGALDTEIQTFRRECESVLAA